MSWLLWSLVLAPLVLGALWGDQWLRSRRLDGLRRVDPHGASDVEQMLYSPNPANLPMRDRSFEKPRDPNQF